MENNGLSLDKLNKFLKRHTFEIEGGFFGLDTLNIKLELIGYKEFIRVGQLTKYIVYRIYVVPTDPIIDKNFNMMWKVYGHTNVFEVKTYDRGMFGDLIYRVNDVLGNFLIQFSVDEPVHCSEIVNTLI